jgi:hypothetical protein
MTGIADECRDSKAEGAMSAEGAFLRGLRVTPGDATRGFLALWRCAARTPTVARTPDVELCGEGRSLKTVKRVNSVKRMKT